MLDDTLHVLSEFGEGQLGWCTGLCVDESGNIYVVDTGNNRVVVFNNAGMVIQIIDGYNYVNTNTGGVTHYPFAMPLAVTVDVEGTVYVADTGHDKVVVIGGDGKYYGSIGFTGDDWYNFSQPEGVRVDEKGGLWVSDTGNNRVIKYQLSKWDYFEPPEALITIPTENTHYNSATLPDAKVNVRGTAKSLRLRNWVLSYGKGCSPAEWIELCQSTTSKNNSKLYEWDISNVPSGQYSLKLIMNYERMDAGIRVPCAQEAFVRGILVQQGKKGIEYPLR